MANQPPDPSVWISWEDVKAIAAWAGISTFSAITLLLGAFARMQFKRISDLEDMQKNCVTRPEFNAEVAELNEKIESAAHLNREDFRGVHSRLDKVLELLLSQREGK